MNLLLFTKARVTQFRSVRSFAKIIPNFYKHGHIKFDFKNLMENMHLIEQNCKNRDCKTANPRQIVKIYNKYKESKFAIDQLRKRRNEHAEQMKSVQAIDDDSKRTEMLRRHQNIGVSIKTDIKKYEDELTELETELMKETLKLPNKTHPDVPIGDESKSRVMFVRGTKPNIDKENGDHLSLGEKHDLFDFENGGKITGSKFVFLKNHAALLELALVNWAIKKGIQKGFTPILTPDVCRTEVLEGCGFQPRDESSQTYHIEEKNINLSLIGTSEAPLAGMHASELLYQKDLPRKYIAFSHCFRKEAGKGATSKGLYRLHQFSKVEMFIYCEPEHSEKYFQEIVDIQCELLDELGFHYRGLDMASFELGASAFRKVDLECWLPSKNDFGEVTSASNCTNYQSRRFNIQYLRGENEKHLVHTLNGTAVATPRIIMAILETYGMKIPDALKPHFIQ